MTAKKIDPSGRRNNGGARKAGTANKRKEAGRPSKYDPSFCEQAFSLASSGATDLDLADAFGVHIATLFRWRAEHQAFREATRLGKDAADDRVEASLYHRAVGYSHEAVKIFLPAGATEPVVVPYREHYPPDTAAASLWLRNRRADKWRDKQDLEHSGPGGGPIQVTRIERVIVDHSANPDSSGIRSAPETGEV